MYLKGGRFKTAKKILIIIYSKGYGTVPDYVWDAIENSASSRDYWSSFQLKRNIFTDEDLVFPQKQLWTCEFEKSFY